MKFTFNTGRQYSPEGQIIHVEVTPERVYFNDESRGIAGSFDTFELPPTSQYWAKSDVLMQYDHGVYRLEPTPKKGEAR